MKSSSNEIKSWKFRKNPPPSLSIDRKNSNGRLKLKMEGWKIRLASTLFGKNRELNGTRQDKGGGEKKIVGKRTRGQEASSYLLPSKQPEARKVAQRHGRRVTAKFRLSPQNWAGRKQSLCPPLKIEPAPLS